MEKRNQLWDFSLVQFSLTLCDPIAFPDFALFMLFPPLLNACLPYPVSTWQTGVKSSRPRLNVTSLL